MRHTQWKRYRLWWFNASIVMYISPFLSECIVSFWFSLCLVSNAIKDQKSSSAALGLSRLDTSRNKRRQGIFTGRKTGTKAISTGCEVIKPKGTFYKMWFNRKLLLFFSRGKSSSVCIKRSHFFCEVMFRKIHKPHIWGHWQSFTSRKIMNTGSAVRLTFLLLWDRDSIFGL